MSFTKRASKTVLGMLLVPVGALAQPEPGDREALRACAVLETAAERIECMDTVLPPQDAEEADAAEAASSSTDGTAAGAQDRAGDARARDDAAQARDDDAQARDDGAQARDDDDSQRTVVVVNVQTSIPGRAIFLTEDGERFVQTSGGSRLFMPDVPFEAVLREGIVGGLFLAPVDGGRAVRVADR